MTPAEVAVLATVIKMQGQGQQKGSSVAMKCQKCWRARLGESLGNRQGETEGESIPFAENQQLEGLEVTAAIPGNKAALVKGLTAMKGILEAETYECNPVATMTVIKEDYSALKVPELKVLYKLLRKEVRLGKDEKEPTTGLKNKMDYVNEIVRHNIPETMEMTKEEIAKVFTVDELKLRLAIHWDQQCTMGMSIFPIGETPDMMAAERIFKNQERYEGDYQFPDGWDTTESEEFEFIQKGKPSGTSTSRATSSTASAAIINQTTMTISRNNKRGGKIDENIKMNTETERDLQQK